jgi:hypothetical protein
MRYLLTNGNPLARFAASKEEAVMKLRLLLVVVVVLFVTPVAFGQVLGDGGEIYNMQGISDGCSGTMNADVCFHTGDWWNTTWWGGTGWTDCGLSGGCATCGTNSFGKRVCVYGIYYSASCSCTNQPRVGSGPGITDCVPMGSCTYRSNP